MRERVSGRITAAAHAARFDASPVRHPLKRPESDRRHWGDDLEAEAARTTDWLALRDPVRSEAGNHLPRLPISFPELSRDIPRGKPVDPEVSAHVGETLGYDFSSVRIHDGATAARLTGRLRARAATFGTNVAFAPGRYRPDDPEGRRLLTHELVHVAQQRTTGPLVQLAPEVAPGTGVLTLSWDVRFKQNRPRANELFAAPEEVLTPEGLSDYRALLMLLTTDPGQQAQIEGSASVEGDPAENIRLSARRARWTANQIGPVHVRRAPGHAADCPELVEGEYACGTSHAHPTVDPADRRVTVQMFRPPAPLGTRLPSPSPPASVPGTSTPPAGTAKAGGQGAASLGGSAGSGQLSVQGGIGYTRHFYTTPAGSKDPLGEWVIQIVRAYTLQFHEDKRPGLELQFPVQVQYSLTTGQWSVAVGTQLSYVHPLAGDKFQWSVFAQGLAGPNISADSWLLQPAAGAQITWQPTDWFNLAIQATGGYTAQTPGPSSVDLGGLFVITVQR
jgi:outer membrane protein OmpA-like peptidoglycan-associated protein